MTNLRCTAKLLQRFGVGRPPDPLPGDNALGDWHANLLFLRGAHLLLCVSEHGRLPVVASARGLRDFPREFPRLVHEVLTAIGVPPETADRECDRMGTLAFGPTRNRSVLGTMNDFTNILTLNWDQKPALSLLDWSLSLADILCGPLNMRRPRDVVPELLASPGAWQAKPTLPLPVRPGFSEFERWRIDQLLMAFRDRRFPAEVRNHVTLTWSFRGQTVTLNELRPALMQPGEWMESKVAQFRRSPQGEWTLYCRDRNSRWHRFAPAAPARDIERLLVELEADRTGIFWG